jgi:ferrous iron transport protein A
MSVALLPCYPNTSDVTANSPLPLCSLLDLGKRQPAIIEAIIANERFGAIDGTISQRLKDLGFLPNTLIHIVAKGLFGKPPFAVQLGTGAQFSLRADELLKIRCRAITVG